MPTPVAEWKFEDLDYAGTNGTTGLISSPVVGFTVTDNLRASSTSGKDSFTSVMGKAGNGVAMNPTPNVVVNYPIVKTGTFDYGLGGSAGLTFETWIQPSALPADPQTKSATLVSVAALSSSIPAGCTYNAGAGYSLKMGLDGLLTFLINKDSTTNGSVSSSTPIVATNWYHVVATYDKTEMRIYINGNLEGTSAYAEEIVSPAATPSTADGSYVACAQFKLFGATTTASADTGNFQGTVDEVRLYNQGLSEAQVNARYESF